MCSPWDLETVKKALAPSDVMGKRVLEVGALDVNGSVRGDIVALWSLSETPPALRDEVMMRMAVFDVFCFAYQPTFGEMDNTAWFGAMRRRLDADVDWHDVPVQQHHASSRHLFGVRRNLSTGRSLDAPSRPAGDVRSAQARR